MLERDVERHLVNGVKAQGGKAYKVGEPWQCRCAGQNRGVARRQSRVHRTEDR